MNYLISALTTSGQLIICLIFLLILLVLEIVTFVLLFLWRKKSLKALKKDNNEQPRQEPQKEATQDSAEQEGNPMSAFLAPIMMLSTASGVSTLRGFVNALAIICMIGAVGAIATAIVFAMQISKKISNATQDKVQEPMAERAPEPQPEPTPQHVEEVVQPAVAEPIAEPEPEQIAEPTPEPQPEPQPQPEEPIVATTADEDESDDDDENEEEEESRIFVESDDGGYFIILERSFMARVIQSKSHVKDYYSQIKNALLSFKKVSARVSKPKESFRYGKSTIACMAVRGKTLRLYLALDPNNYFDGRFKIDDVSNLKTFEDTPLLLKISNERRCEYAIELIEDLMIKLDVAPDDNFEEIDYVKTMPYESNDALVEKGLIVKKLAKGKSLLDSKVVDVISPNDEEQE